MMNKFYTFKIKDNIYKTTVKKKKTSESAIRYIKMSLKKKYDIDIYQEALNAFIKDKDVKCPFCDNDPAYELDYAVNGMIIEIHGLNHIKSKGKINYHCKGGKKSGCPGSFLNPNSIEYLSKALLISPEEANKLILETNKSPFYSTNFSNKKDYIKSQKRDLDWYTKRHGETKGENLFNERNLKLSFSNSYLGLEKKYGTEIAKEISAKKASCSLKSKIGIYGEIEGPKRYKEHIEKVKTTLENFIQRYGEIEGSKKYSEYCEKNAYKNTLNYYTDRYGEKDGITKYAKWRKKLSFTKQDYIKKYGEEAYIEKLKRQMSTFYSSESIIAFDKLMDEIKNILPIKNIKYKDDEYYIYDSSNKRIYFYDLYFEIEKHKFIVEYDTPFMHPNKNYLTIDEYNNWRNPWDDLMTPQDKEAYDIQKINTAKNKNIQVFNFYVKEKTDVLTNINLILKSLNEKYGIK